MQNSQTIIDPIREEILDAAKELFKQHGYKKTLMEDIAKKIGKSKSSLYYYYKTKDEIFEQMFTCDLRDHIELAKKIMQTASTVQEKFKALIMSLIDKAIEHSKDYTTLEDDITENPIFFLRMAKSRDIHLEALLKDMLILGISTGEIKVMSTQEMDLWARMMNTSIHAFGKKIFLDKDISLNEAHVEFLVNNIFHGIAKR